jgi:hypothetical protein
MTNMSEQDLTVVAALCTVVGTNLCVRDPLERKSLVIREVSGVPDNEAYNVYTGDIISQRQCFVARSLISYVGNVFGLQDTRYLFENCIEAESA